MKAHRDHKYRPDRPAGHRVKRQVARQASPTLATNLTRTRAGEVAVVLPEALLWGMNLGTRLWMTVAHGVLWFTRAPVGPRHGHRAHRRTRRGPPARIVRDKRCKKRSCLRLMPLWGRLNRGVRR